MCFRYAEVKAIIDWEFLENCSQIADEAGRLDKKKEYLKQYLNRLLNAEKCNAEYYEEAEEIAQQLGLKSMAKRINNVLCAIYALGSIKYDQLRFKE